MTGLTKDVLDATLPHMLQAPKDNGIIETLCYRPTFGARVISDELTLSVQDGVVGDRWKELAWLKKEDGSPDPRIQVCIIPKRLFDCVKAHVPDAKHPGDTMIVDMDMSEENLPEGTLLQAGTATLRVTDIFNDACTKWSARYGKESRVWINTKEYLPLRLRGVLCEIVASGHVTISDTLIKQNT